jgi:hypothetical protein
VAALTAVLVGLEVLWIVSLVGAGVRRAVRNRFLLTSLLGWLLSTVIATEAKPAERALPVGVLVGSCAAVGLALATRSGVTFTVMPNKEYWPDDKRPPIVENLLLLFMLACGCFAIVTLAVRG